MSVKIDPARYTEDDAKDSWGEDEIGYEGYDDRQTDETAEYSNVLECADIENDESRKQDCAGGEERPPGVIEGVGDGIIDVAMFGVVGLELVKEMNGVVDGDSQCDRGDHRRADVQANTQVAHGAEHYEDRKQVRYHRETCHPHRTKERNQGKPYRDQCDAQAVDLSLDHAVRHARIQNGHAGHLAH